MALNDINRCFYPLQPSALCLCTLLCLLRFIVLNTVTLRVLARYIGAVDHVQKTVILAVDNIRHIKKPQGFRLGVAEERQRPLESMWVKKKRKHWVSSRHTYIHTGCFDEPAELSGEQVNGLFWYSYCNQLSPKVYSHASVHEHRLDYTGASSQLKVDGSVRQNHPLSPQITSFEKSNGWQWEILKEGGKESTLGRSWRFW